MMAGGTLCIFKEGYQRHCVWHFTRHSAFCICPLVSNTHWNVTHTWITLQFCLSVCDCLVDIMHYAFYLRMIATDGLCILKQRCSFECNWLKSSYYTLEQYIMSVGHFSDIWLCLWHAGPLNTSGIGCSAKTFNRWLPSNVCVGKLRLTVTGTWVLLWSDVSLIWYQHIVIFILATVFSSWFPSKDIQLQALMKALVVFRWLMFHIILLCSLVNRHQAYIINCSHGEKCFTGAVILFNNI